MLKLNYPVLICSKKFVRGQTKNENQLCIRTKKSLKDKLYDDCIIFDVEGYKYQIVNYQGKPSTYVALINVVNGLLDFFTRPKDEYSVWIDFDLRQSEKCTFSECKNEIAKYIKANPKWFNKSYEDFDSIDDKLSSYDSLEELIMCLAGYP